MRLFIAFELPASLQESIQEKTSSLRRVLNPATVRWVPAENVHLTLKFLGEVQAEGTAALTQMLGDVTGQFPAFEISIQGAGAFPNASRPRVIWVGLQGPPTLLQLHLAIERGVQRLGYPADEQAFSPHLTIGRVRRGAGASELHEVHAALKTADIGLVGSANVEAVRLFRSDLRPDGSVYTRLHTASLSAPASMLR